MYKFKMTTEDNQDTNEYEMLCDSQISRLETYQKYKDFIHNLENGNKQKRYRKWLKNILITISKARVGDTLLDKYTLDDLQKGNVKPFFYTQDDEYEVINKFGRGMWDEHSIRNGFNLADQDIVIEIAKGYGAFDY
jgi:hypothetical protein